MSRRKPWIALTALVVLLGSTLALSACYVRARGGEVGVEGEYEVDAPPPAAQEDVVLTSPGPGYVWIGGAYEYNRGGRAWGWKAGRWERPPREGQTWVGAHFETRSGKHYYRRGYWH
jgi:hypothetical protein